MFFPLQRQYQKPQLEKVVIKMHIGYSLFPAAPFVAVAGPDKTRVRLSSHDRKEEGNEPSWHDTLIYVAHSQRSFTLNASFQLLI